MTTSAPSTLDSTNHAIETLRRSAHFDEAVQMLQDIWRAEQKKRAYFYEIVTEYQKAEFIQGEIIVHSPVKLKHNAASLNLATLLKTYVQRHNLGHIGHEKLLISLARNDYEPDICYFSVEKSRAFTPDQMKFPAPDFIAEVLSESTAANDRGVKFVDYALHGVAEYWIVDPDQETIEQYLRKESSYVLALKVKNGSIASEAIAGFEIPVRAVFDTGEQMAALKAMLA
jgi:Uma2 family endonuclease